MARFRVRRILLWGLLFLPVLAVAFLYVMGRAWINRQLERDLILGQARIRLSAPRLGWGLDFTADSLSITSPTFQAAAGKVDARLRLFQSLLNMTPSFKAAVDTLRLDLAHRADRTGSKVLRLRPSKPTAFPKLRIPIPFRLEAAHAGITRAGRPLAAFSDLAVYSQGPKGAALQWSSVRLDSATELQGSFKASARWFGRWVRYQARFQGGNGDMLRIEGERYKSDLARGRDTLEASVASLDPYLGLLKGRPSKPVRVKHPLGEAPRGASKLSALRLAASLGNDRPGGGFAAEARLDMRVPGPLRLGPMDVAARLSFQDSSGRLGVEVRGGQGETAHLQGLFSLPLGDSLVPADMPRSFKGAFSGFSRDVRFRIARWTLPGDFEIKSLRIADGEGRAEVRSRDNSEIMARIFKDTGAAEGRPGWGFTFTGDASPTETWARVWTDTNVNYRSAAVTGVFRPGELTVEVRGKGVTAYGAAADSLWARNRVRKRGYYLDDSRLYRKDVVWPVQGEVEWGERRPVRGPRGLRLSRDVRLSFRASHPSHGRLEFAMPKRGRMEVTSEGLAAEFLPVPRLAKAAAFHPHLTGRFAWDWKERTGESDLHASLIYGGRKLGSDLKAAWDPSVLRVDRFDVAMGESRLAMSAQVLMHGRQFHQVRKVRPADILELSAEARRFEAARLDALIPGGSPLDSGALDGRMTYSDSLGFQGNYRLTGLRLKALRGRMDIPEVTVDGQGSGLAISARTVSQKSPWLNDTVRIKAMDLLGNRPGLSLELRSAGGLAIGFKGELPGFNTLRGAFSAEGDLLLPGAAGMVRGLRIAGALAAPLDRGFLAGLKLDSTVVEGRYAVEALDTQSFRGGVELRDGRLVVPGLKAVDGSGRTLSAAAELRLAKPLQARAWVRGESLALRLKDFQQLSFRDVDASLRADSTGITAEARAGGAAFQSKRGAVSAGGELENLQVAFSKARTGEGGREPVPRLGVKARLHHFTLKHKIGFREMQRSIRTVKVDKRRKRIKPVELDVSLEAAGSANRVETDILRMFFTGDLAVKGIYPYTLATGEISAQSGEIGQTSQSYDIKDFALKWQNATMEEGRIRVEGAKRLRVDCRPETQRTCNVYIKLEGRLDEMAFTYDSDCGQTAGGEVIEPAALINSVSRGCYSGDYVSGAGGGGGYGEAMFTFLEPAISENLTRRVSKVTDGWIKSTQVSGIGAVVSKDTTADAEPISVSLETKQWNGVRGMAKAGYHPENTVNNPWENKVAVEWRLPLEKVASDSGWKRRVRDRVTLEASAETRPEHKLKEDESEVREQIGLRYRFKFWKLW